MTQLYRLVEGYQQAFHTLHDMLDEGAIDAASLVDTMEGLEGELKDKAINVGLHIKNLRSDLEQVKAVQDEFASRAKRIASSIEFFERYLDANLRKSGIDLLKNEYVQIKYKALPAIVEVTGEVPEQYQRVIPEKREPDKRAIAEALKAGQEVAGAELITGRTKIEIK